MISKLIIVEDDAEITALLAEGLAAYGFTAPVRIASTEQIVERIAACYDQPTLLLSDYCVPPTPLGRYLPSLREAGIALPTVVMSGRIRAEQINDLTLTYPVRGFFEKSNRVTALIGSLAKHLIDLGPEAIEAWETYRLARETDQFIARLRVLDCAAMLRLLSMEDCKRVATEVGVGINTVYSLRQAMLDFVGQPVSTQRYVALLNALNTALNTAQRRARVEP